MHYRWDKNWPYNTFKGPFMCLTRLPFLAILV